MLGNLSIRLNRLSESILDSRYIGPVLMALFFMPQEYAIGQFAFKIWQYAQMIVFIVTICVILLNRVFSARWVMFCGFYLCFYLVSSVANGAFAVMSSNIYECARGVAFINLCELYYRRSPKDLLRSIATGGGLMCLLHVLSVAGVLLHVIPKYSPTPLGNYSMAGINYFLLTYDNESVFYLLPAIVSLILFGWGYSMKVLASGIGLYVVTVVEFIILNTVTGLVSMFILLIGLGIAIVVGRITGIRTRFRYKRIYTAGIVVALSICALVVVGVSTGALANVAISMGKDGTFSGRSEIWSRAINSVLSHPLLGRGREGFEITTGVIGQTHVHNILLELLYTGGIVTLALYAGGIYACAIDSNSSNPDTVAFFFSLGAIAAFFVAAYMDWYPAIPVTIFLFYAPNLLDRESRYRRLMPNRADESSS